MSDREEECFYSIALSLVPHLGLRRAKALFDKIGNATDIFKYRKELFDKIPDLNPEMINYLDSSESFYRAEEEMDFIKKNKIDFYLFNEESYSARFRECDDASFVLFSKGNINLNTTHVVSIVGTRTATSYGKSFCETFVRDLKTLCPDIIIVSGLAYGIDICAHKAAIENDLSTIGVIAHGLDRIYPALHRSVAVKMLQKGGLLTEYISGTSPDRYNFVSRNRIVAGISDATIVIESAKKGGSLITAEIAQSYNRDCFALPGRIKDVYSVGCNNLIHDNKAMLLSDAEDFINTMGWIDVKKKQEAKAVQRDLFLELNDKERNIVQLLQQRGNLQVNTLAIETGIPIYKITSILFDMEMKRVVKAMAGGVYQLL